MLPDQFSEPLGGGCRALGAGIEKAHYELFSAEPGKQFAFSFAGPQQRASSSQDLVSGHVAVGVVCFLEVVDVHYEAGNHEVVTQAQGHLGVGGLEKMPPVVQSGKLVRDGKLLQEGVLFLELLHEVPDPEERFHPGDKLFVLKGLHQEVAGAEVETGKFFL